MPPISEVTILLPKKEAELFIMFQENFDTFKLLLDKGVFNQRNAAVTLHFDNVGTLQLIQRADSLYSRKHEG